ncbi:hypothetical protein ACF0H5_006034 [Mactra antiquata]
MSDDKEKKDVDPEKDPNVDGGFAWVILGGCFVSYLLVIGSIKSYGVLYTEIVSSYGSGTGSAAWIGSTVLLGTLGLSPVVNILGKKFTFRRVAFIGGIFLGTGYFLSGFVSRIEILFLTFGLCAGIGYGMTFSPCSTIISYYFKEHRALANGIVVSASGVGAICLPFIYKSLIQEYGLKGAFWIIGGILSHVCVSACLFRQPRLLVENREREIQQRQLRNKDGGSSGVLSCCGALGYEMKFKLFKNPRFTLNVLALVFAMNGFGNNLILIPSQIKALGYGKFYISLGVTIMGACEVVSRIFFGWLADTKLTKVKYIFLFCMSISAIISFAAPFLTTFEMLGVYAGLVGTFPGSIWSQLPILVIDVVGMEHFPSAFGLVLFSLAIGCAISQPLVGWLHDYTGNWRASFIFTGVTFICAVLIILMEDCILKLFKYESLEPDKKIVVPEKNADENVPLQNNHVIMKDETDSLLSEDKFQDDFTSSRISRTYKPYDNSKTMSAVEPASPVPIVNSQEL